MNAFVTLEGPRALEGDLKPRRARGRRAVVARPPRGGGWHLRSALRSGAMSACVLVSLLPVAIAQDEQEGDLPRRQRDVGTILADVAKRMDRLAELIQPSQPEEARRLRTAAERVRVSRIDDLVQEISALLGGRQFEAAVVRQDAAMKELDAIIGLLEEARYRDGSERLDETDAARREVAAIQGKQEKLLSKTREFRESAAAREMLRDVARSLADLARRQAGLNDSTSGGDPDPEGTKADAEALDRALELVDRLRSSQEEIQKRMRALQPGRLPIREARELAGKLDELISRADALEVAGDERAAAPEAGGESPETSAGSPSPAKDAAGGAQGPSEEAPREEPTEEGTPPPEGTSERTPEGAEPAAKDEGAGPAGAKPPPGEAAPDAAEKAADDPLRAASELVSDMDELSREVAGDPSQGDDVKGSLAGAVAEARTGLEDAGTPREKAASTGRKAAEGLRKAREALSRSLSGMEEANQKDTAGLAQEQGELGLETAKGSGQTRSSAENSSAEKSRDALSKGSEAMEQAAEAMRQAAEGLGEGERDAAREGSSRAQESLDRARAALEQGRKDLAARGPAEQAADLQRKIAKKTEETLERIRTLQKKIGKKDPPAAARLAGAEKSIDRARGAMQDAAASRGRGDASAARAQGQQAAEQLEEARQQLEGEELARLDKEPLRKSAEEQDELARLTRNVSKKLSQRAGGSGSESESMEDAAGSMEQAGQDLQKEDAEAAEKDQEEALAKLRSAKEKLDREADELARLNREREMLSMVEELTKIKEREEAIHAETLALAKRRGPQESRRQRNIIQQSAEGLAKSQDELATTVDSLDVKLKDELSRVFSFVLRGVGADMRQIRDALKDIDVGSYTQFLQKEVIEDVDRLLLALKDELSKMEEEKKQEGSPMPAGEAPRRLVPMVAELRMLKEMQSDVNRTTQDLEDLRKASPDGVSDSWGRALDRLLQKQGSVSRLTGELLRDFESFRTPPEGGLGPQEGAEEGGPPDGGP